ncbi:MAG: hypothetical protein KDB79_05820 [Acidobacteria bacterium]|nr:hypothetical protein [Acidobacteriota bacterium]
MNYLFQENEGKIRIISEVKALLNEFSQQIEIFFKKKETRTYRIELTYQIGPGGNPTRMILKYFDKISNSKSRYHLDLSSYEDIYSLVDKIKIKDNVIVLTPKKSYRASLATEKYETPIKIEIATLKEQDQQRATQGLNPRDF